MNTWEEINYVRVLNFKERGINERFKLHNHSLEAVNCELQFPPMEHRH